MALSFFTYLLSFFLLERFGLDSAGGVTVGIFAFTWACLIVATTKEMLGTRNQVQSLSLSLLFSFITVSLLLLPLIHPTGDMPSLVTRCNPSHCLFSSLITASLLLSRHQVVQPLSLSILSFDLRLYTSPWTCLLPSPDHSQ